MMADVDEGLFSGFVDSMAEDWGGCGIRKRAWNKSDYDDGREEEKIIVALLVFAQIL